MGMSAQREYPSLEALLEAEATQPDKGYYLAARIVPAGGLAIALGVFLPLALAFSPFFHIGTVGFIVSGIFGWFLFDRLDRAITPARKEIRRVSRQIWTRYVGFGNLVGKEPAVSESVGEVLDEAAAIYLKRASSTDKNNNEAYRRACQALEIGMAKLLELAASPSVRTQELEFESGWALPLLREMRQTDEALTRLSQYAEHTTLPVDPLANLRDVRTELSGVVSAIEEIEQRHTP
jgi:hypothetical protein